MKWRLLAVGLMVSFGVTTSTFALGGLAGYYQQLNQGTNSSNYSTSNTVYSNNTNTGTGGLAGYYERLRASNPSYNSASTNSSTTIYTNNTKTGTGGLAGYYQRLKETGEGYVQNTTSTWQQGLQANTFGSYCPVVNRPSDDQCNGTWEAQYQTSTGCLTHYFCDRTPDDEDPVYCPLNYDPVCGQLPNGNQVTYSNECFLGVAGARFLYRGQCQGGTVPGKPVIHNFTGPNELTVGEVGTWVVRASGGYNNQNLSYMIDWGERIYANQSARAPYWGQNTSFTHTYNAEGTYTVRVTVRDEQGNQASTSRTVRVVNDHPIDYPPKIQSFQGPSELYVGENGTWTVTATDPTDRPVSFSIDWGELARPYKSEGRNENTAGRGRWGSSQTFYHAYTQEGTYTVTVTARSAGGTDTQRLTVRVKSKATTGQAPVIHGVSGPTTLETNQTGTWRVQASDPQNQDLRYQIDWGDYQPYAASSRMAPVVQTGQFTHAYSQTGYYTVKFTVTNQAGLSAKTTISVRVTSPHHYPWPGEPIPMDDDYHEPDYYSNDRSNGRSSRYFDQMYR